MCSGLPAGTSRLSTGASAQTAISATKKAVQPLPLSSGPLEGSATLVIRKPPRFALRYSPSERPCGSCFGTPTFDSEDALWPLLDEDDDEDQHRDLREHRAGPAFDELVEHAQAERRVHGAGELADAAHHHHHEG